jgi:quinol monooxygenase YgiN
LIVVTGHVRFAPEKIAGLRPHIRAMLEATRKEPGCLVYAFAEDFLDPGVIRIVERWDTWPALEAHGKMAHMVVWRAAVKEAGVLDREVTAHEVGEERAL